MLRILICAILLTSTAIGATYDYELRFPTSGGYSSVLVLYGSKGTAFTDTVTVSSFPYYDTVSINGAYFTRFQALWIATGDTGVSEWIVPSVDSSDAGSYDYLLSYPVGSTFDSVRTSVLRNGYTATGSVGTATFPYTYTIALNAGYFYTLYNKWYAGTDTFITSTEIPPMPGGFASEIPDPGANLCTVYGYVSGVDTAVAKNALVYFSLANKVNDTCNDVILVNFVKTTRADRYGRFEQNLIRSSCLGGAEYNAKIMLRDGSTITHSFAVPDSTSYRLIW